MMLVGLYLPTDEAFAASKAKNTMQKPLSKKKADGRDRIGITPASVPIRLVWQVIRSQGEGALMNSSATTFSLDGRLFQIGESSWTLRFQSMAIPGYYVPARYGLDGRMILDRAQLLKLMGVDLLLEWQSNPDEEILDEADHVDIPLHGSSVRQMETMYRGPEEELYLIKVSAHLI